MSNMLQVTKKIHAVWTCLPAIKKYKIMKILFINTLLHGGAAKGAQFLFDLISEEMKNSKFIYLHGKNETDSRYQKYSDEYWFDMFGSRYISNFIKNRILTPFSLIIYRNFYKTDPNLMYVSHCRSRFRGIDIYNSDIFHLNWIANFLDFRDFFSKEAKNKKIIWTLSDMNPFTGGCHYSCDMNGTWCYQYYQGCENCLMLAKNKNGKMIKKMFQTKYDSINKIKTENMKIVCPSLWVMEESKKSKLFSRFEHIYISHGVNIDVFNLLERNRVRKKHKLSKDQKVILFVSDIINDKRKGLLLLIEAIKGLKLSNIVILTVGKAKIQLPCEAFFNLEIKHYGFISSDEKMAELYNCADVFISPSIAESFGFTIAESLCCGTPVIAFNTSAITEKITDGENGYLAINLDSCSLKECISKYFVSGVSLSREEISSSARNKYSHIVMKNKYLNLYNDILKEY